MEELTEISRSDFEAIGSSRRRQRDKDKAPAATDRHSAWHLLSEDSKYCIQQFTRGMQLAEDLKKPKVVCRRFILCLKPGEPAQVRFYFDPIRAAHTAITFLPAST